MGATKLLGEKLLSAEAFHTKSKTIFASVRFGNVLHTRGSILPRIEDQIKNGGPITLTDKRMKRFFMTKNDAVKLIVNATNLATGGEIFVLKMPLLNLNDLFEVMKDVLAPKYGFNPKQIETKIVGIQSKNGRHLAMMPHPERSYLGSQWSYRPSEVGALSPWFQIFKNARLWLD